MDLANPQESLIGKMTTWFYDNKKKENMYPLFREKMSSLATLIWLYTLLRLKARHNPTATVLPILIDSPSYGELDDTKEDELWRFLFDLPTPEAQLIITKLSFPEELGAQYSVDKVIMLTNPKYQMLNSEDYAAHIGILQSLHNDSVHES